MVTSPSTYRHDLRAAHARLDALPAHTVALLSGPVEYLDQGQGHPVLLVHGIFGGHDAALRLADPEALTGHRLIAPSRFGYLGTAMPPRPTLAKQADAHAGLLDALGLDRLAVLAGSAGVTSAVELAVRHPDRVAGLVLLSSNAPGPQHDHDVLPRWLAKRLWSSEALMWAASTWAPRSITALMGVPKDLPLSADDQKRLGEELDAIFPVSHRVAGCLFDAFVGNKAINAVRLEDVQAPTLVIHFRDDSGAPFAGAQTLARRIPNAETLFLDHGGHLGLGEHPEVSPMIQTFLDRVLQTH